MLHTLLTQLTGEEEEDAAPGSLEPTPFTERYSDNPVGFIESVLKTHVTDDIARVAESVRDNTTTIARSANSVGKTHGSARIAVWFYKTFPGSQVITTAAPPFRNLKQILWGEIGSVIEKRPELFLDDKITTMHIQRSKKSFITGVAIPTAGSESDREAKFSGKHAPHLLFIVDEGDAVMMEVYKGIESCMTGDHVRLLIMFNPKMKIGPVYQKEFTNQAKVIALSALTHPNVVTGNNLIPGAVDRPTTVRRINEWTRPLAPGEKAMESEIFTPPDFLVGSSALSQSGLPFPPLPPGPRKIKDGEPQFYYMVLGQYPTQGQTQLISDAWIERAIYNRKLYVAKYGENPPQGVTARVGQDVAEFGGDYNFLCFRWGAFVENFKHFWQGVDPEISMLKALNIHNETGKDRIDLWFVDGTGVGSSVAPSLARRKVRALSVKVAAAPSPVIRTEIGSFRRLRDQLWWACREWLRIESNNAMLPDDPFLIQELKTPTYHVGLDGNVFIMDKDEMRKFLGRSPDRADALCLTFTPFERAKSISISR